MKKPSHSQLRRKPKTAKSAPKAAKSQPKRRAAPTPPERIPLTRTFHGQDISDDFAWLRADNWKQVLKTPAKLPKKIRAFLEAENKYADAVLAPVKTLRKQLVKEMRGRTKEDDSQVPAPDGAWLYYDRYRKGGQHPLACRKPREGGKEQILIDGEKLGKGKAFFDIEATAHSPDHSRIAWSADTKGSEYFTIRIREAGKERDRREQITDTDGSIVWSADSNALYYVRMDENHRPYRVYRHRLGTSVDKDELVFEEKNPRWFIHLSQTQSGRFGEIEVADHETSETRLIDLTQDAPKPRRVAERRERVRFDVSDHDDTLFILTNADGAVDFKIVQAPLKSRSSEQWHDLIPHKPGRLITGMTAFARHLVRTEREDGLPRIVIREIASGDEHAIAFDEEAYDLDLGEVLEYDTDVLRFSYSSLTTPWETWDYNMATRERTLRKRQEIPSGHDPKKYVTRRIYATSHDGTEVPISILHARKTKIDGKAPLFLNGYGSYGYSTDAGFRSNIFSLVDRGFVYAIAHIRGGTDKGWNWYLDGKLEKKTNTFHDFIACAKHLARKKFTAEGNVVAIGGSAGGMLMGAVANMAPQVFAGIIAAVPFVDVLNTMLDDTLPLTPPEWFEWGNPIADKTAFDTIRGYSPYDNVRAQYYPPILAEGGLTDPRVTYWEPAKWVAKLRSEMTSGGPILLRTNMGAGHGGSPGRFTRLEEVAVEYAFAIMAAKHQLKA
ncbi:S9 family peptidase [Methylocella sp. CPCC 101449]|uniref:S9 family peptidase n=1 Tax=Methylocella sp. CPCC 101449 TaxID=2987531 RepID=UPI00288EF603|nr:S9 family peptidase [Methylocella sp. CPCC 101449]MDT2024207.1 S9 family peptidase [Methylocella sp. CPCC 101449]